MIFNDCYSCHELELICKIKQSSLYNLLSYKYSVKFNVCTIQLKSYKDATSSLIKKIFYVDTFPIK